MPTFPENLEPALIWQHFARICGVPHGSGHEAALRASLIEWAEDRNLEHAVDDVGNLVIRVPATPGYEDRPTTVIQGHIDMVCEKEPELAHDFATDPIQVVLEDGFVTAVGTTLGADNGIGVACGMAIADDPDAEHGPLELLCTVDEERGMTGAFGLKPGFVTGTRMLNLDTEEEGALYVGCAGGGDVDSRWAVQREAAPAGYVGAKITVKGLVGGHSGLDIHRNRANAIKCLAQALWAAQSAEIPLRIEHFQGGSMRNAVPRDAWATVAVPGDTAQALAQVVAAQQAELQAIFGRTDPGLTVTLSEAPVGTPWTARLTQQVLSAIVANPSGVAAMSPDVPGLVETSNNLGVVRTTADSVEMVNCTRSSRGPDLEALRQSIRAVHLLAGAEVTLEPSYPGWQPDMSSPLLAKVQAVHEAVFGRPAAIKAIHAGLECGLLKRAYPDMDMISMGPDIFGAHSPSERLSVASTAKFYTLVKATLAALD
ncbi:MAG: aminoacyl-histidine dipeptidase [Myxococcales bacterium]|nr:aminoacyl-histidine dipeptidase [Myxococcales bacterium]